ncbi:SusC/RagA family TonB-linked outer membrane protein, partial [Bacteroides cellulosilyticus]
MMKNVVQKIQKIPFLFMLVLVFFTCISASAQIQIKGTVVSANDSEPMIGVAILEEGTSNGRITDLNGNYSIQVSNSNATLTASFIGYKTQTVKVNGRSVINFRLEEDTQVLDEVVVVGYGVQRKSDLTGAVASVNSKDLKGLATTDAAAALQGKAAGIQILNSSGAPGSGAEIRVRGYSSNSGNIGPLLIVDGLKVSSIQYLDPGLIESMEVLKDAASAAIYGSEAGNGVVLITTKNGGGKGTGKITYNVRYTMNQLGHVPQLLNAEEFKDWMGMQGYNVEAAMSDAIRDYNWDQNTDTNWFDEFMGTSWSKQHSLSFQGSNDKGQYFANLTYVNQDGIVKGKNDYYERLTAQINADYKIKPWLQVGTNTSIEKWRRGSVSEYGYGSAFEMLLVMDPLTPTHWTDRSQYLAATGSVYDAVQNGTSATNYRFYGDDRGMYATSYFNTELAGGTPFAQRDKNANNKNGGINVHSTFFANLTPFKGFTFTSRFGTRITQGNTYSYAEPYYITGRVSDTKYSISQTTSNGLYYQWENFANYMTSIGKHSISAMAGMSYIQSESNGTTAGASGEELLSSY